MDVDYVLNYYAFSIGVGGFWIANMDNIKETDGVEDRFKKPRDVFQGILDNYFMVGQVGVFEGIRLLKCNIYAMEIIDEDEEFNLPSEPSFSQCYKDFEKAYKIRLPNQLSIDSKEYDKLIDIQAQKYRDILLEAHAKLWKKLKDANVIDMGKYSKPPVPLK